MEIFIGIDQSINSTGITLQVYEDNIKVKENFYIITGKITKKEDKLQNEISNFEYVLYDKIEKKNTINNNDFENSKLLNNINITNIILDIIKYFNKFPLAKIFIGMEGISFQSFQSKSLIDLAGLSYILRYRLYKYFNNNDDHKGGVFILTPGEVKRFASGNGNASKEIMVNLFKALYNEFNKLPKVDDIADSYWICSYLKNNYDNQNDLYDIQQ